MTNNDGKLTLLELVARARGTTRTASEGHIRLIRKTEQGYVEMALSLRDIQKGKQQDVQLQPDDIVYAPFSFVKGVIVSTKGIVASAGTASIYHF